MALTLTDFLTAFPELDQPSPLSTEAPLEASKIEALLFEVETYHITSSAFYGTRTTRAQLLLTAHFYEMLRGIERHGSDGVGPITSRTQGGTSKSFGQQRFDRESDMLLSTTRYGRRLMAIQKASPSTGCLTGGVV